MENEKIGHFKILREIGSGGFGTVYLAYDEEIDEYAALKKVENFSERKHERRGIYYYKKNRENFRSENIISIHETIKFGDDMYYSMPIADGMGGVACSETNYTPKTLELAIKERLKQGGGWFSEDEILDIIIPIAKALAAVDKCGLKHRDVKPANIIFIKGKPMLSDFGLAAQDTSSLSRAGTADYTPPAWFADSGGDPDMWGFAMTFFALFSGKPPSESKNNRKYPKCWSEKDFLKNRGAWDKFAQIVFRVKNENESERFPNWDALLNALYKLRGFSDKYKNPAGKPANKRRLLNYFLYPAIALLLLAAMAFSIYSGGSPAIKEQAEARPEKPKANPENVKLVKDKINAEIERRTQIYKKELDSYKEKI
ncbi:MAG: protein kinase, partial [Opitutales bacterium]|nr:protein kinase [Opitutales bacterium]